MYDFDFGNVLFDTLCPNPHTISAKWYSKLECVPQIVVGGNVSYRLILFRENSKCRSMIKNKRSP